MVSSVANWQLERVHSTIHKTRLVQQRRVVCHHSQPMLLPLDQLHSRVNQFKDSRALEEGELQTTKSRMGLVTNSRKASARWSSANSSTSSANRD